MCASIMIVDVQASTGHRTLLLCHCVHVPHSMLVCIGGLMLPDSQGQPDVNKFETINHRNHEDVFSYAT